jgi:hypothetical protein
MYRAPSAARSFARRDGFLGLVSQQRRLYAVQGEQGLARLPSRRLRGREVTLFWSLHEPAARMAQCIAEGQRVREFTLAEMLASVLPGLAVNYRLAGLDWTGEDDVMELDPLDLSDRLRLASLDVFVQSVQRLGRVFTIEGPYGPGLLRSQSKPEILVLPAWAEAGEAHARLEGPWRNMLVIETPLEDFLEHRMAWLTGNGHLVGPDYKDGPGVLEMQPADLAAYFAHPAA